MSGLPVVKAKLRKARGSMGWAPYWVVDEGGNLLNTEPVCSVPDGYHEWFKEHIEAMEFEYWGLLDEVGDSTKASPRLEQGE